MNLYIKNIDGITHIMPANKIIIVKNGMQTFNPTEDMLFDDGWTIYVPEYSDASDEDMLNIEKEHLINNICLYDSSDNVNVFYVNNIPMWLDKSTRAGLMLRLQAETALGLEETTLWYDSLEFKMTIEVAFQLLYALEVYASKCYDKTQHHIVTVKSLEFIENVKSYDYTTGYPDKLHINL